MKVTKEEFEEFLSSYKSKLTTDNITICEPPRLGYYDFENYEGFDALVAHSCEMLNKDYKPTGEYEYIICKEDKVKMFKDGVELTNKWSEDTFTASTPEYQRGILDVTYNPDKVKVVWGGIEIEDFAEGDFITIKAED